jgi:Tfp pilus assembly pilus retraction ATPase PilT
MAIASDGQPYLSLRGISKHFGGVSALKDIDHPALTPSETKEIIYSIMTDKQKKIFEDKWELDFSFGVKDLGRFRANVFMQKGAVAGAFRRFLPTMWTFAQLGIPQRIAQLCYLPRGWCLSPGDRLRQVDAGPAVAAPARADTRRGVVRRRVR